MRINTVDCEVEETYFNGKKTRFVMPVRVNNLEFLDFAVFAYAEKAPDPEAERFHALLSMVYYYGNCYAYLLHQREFDLFSLSSLDFSPRLRELCETVKIDPTGSPLLDNIQRMIELGRPIQPKNWDDIVRGAVFRYPEWIPVLDDTGDAKAWLDMALENANKEALRMIGESSEPLERVWGRISTRIISLLTFMAERETFEVLHQGMERVYRMIEDHLDADEKLLFRSRGLKNPRYLNRIVCFDPSAVTRSFRKIKGEIYRKFGIERASTILTPKLLGRMLISYLNFYPIWLRFKLDEEAEKRQQRKQAVEEKPYDPSLDGEVVDKPDYTMDSLMEILANAKTPYPYDKKPPKESISSDPKGKKKQNQTFLTDLEKKIVRLQATGASNKAITEAVGRSRSYVSKVWKAVRQISRNSWEKGWHRPFLENLYRITKRRYGRLPPNARSRYKDLYTTFLRNCIHRMGPKAHVDPEQLEKELLPPCFRK